MTNLARAMTVTPILIRTMACVLAVTVANPRVVLGQAAPPATDTAPSDASQANAPKAEGQPVFRTEEIDQMTAPIALYPDQLLAQVLIAATYPLEVVQADRWLANPANAELKGDQLAAALEQQSWDPSVKSLVPFPQVLKMMSEKLDWTQRLGDAFLAQQADVMGSVQRLRREAQSAGTLKSTEQQTVVMERETVIIQPAKPEVVYVPTYNPTVVYGTWPYPAYPPVYYPPPPAYYPGYYAGGALVSGMAFGLGVAAVASLSGCCNTNWGGNNVNINASRYNTINASNIRSGRASQIQSNANTWRHDPSHRGGVAYRDAATRQSFQGQGARSTSASRDFRGYDGGQRGGGQGTSRPAAERSAAGQRQGGAAAAARQPSGQADRQPRSGASARTPSQSRQPSAFQGMGNGSQVRTQADRGRASQQSMGSQAPSRAAASGGARAGGGARGGGAGGRGGGGRR